jgi:hypothetical protein
MPFNIYLIFQYCIYVSMAHMMHQRVDSYLVDYETYLNKFGKSLNRLHDKNRLDAFISTFDHIIEHNTKRHVYSNTTTKESKTFAFKLELNRFSDWSSDDFDSLFGVSLAPSEPSSVWGSIDVTTGHLNTDKSDKNKTSGWRIFDSNTHLNVAPIPVKSKMDVEAENGDENGSKRHRTLVEFHLLSDDDNDDDGDDNGGSGIGIGGDNEYMNREGKSDSTTSTISRKKNYDYRYLNWASDNNPFGLRVVPPTRDQGECGACWAFTAVAATEATVHLSTGIRPFHLSTEELIDCDHYYDLGCMGGNPMFAFGYITINGLTSQNEYPYAYHSFSDQSGVDSNGHDPTKNNNKLGKCMRSDANLPARAGINSFAILPSRNEDAIKSALQLGPVAVGVCGSDPNFVFYSGGIYNDQNCCITQNHALLLVGYGFDSFLGLNYFIAQNSWGTDWGEGGFIRILRNEGIDTTNGICSMAINPSMPLGGYIYAGGSALPTDNNEVYSDGWNTYNPFDPLGICRYIHIWFTEFKLFWMLHGQDIVITVGAVSFVLLIMDWIGWALLDWYFECCCGLSGYTGRSNNRSLLRGNASSENISNSNSNSTINEGYGATQESTVPFSGSIDEGSRALPSAV